MPKEPKTDIPDELTLSQQLCFAVHAASGVIGDHYRPLLAEHDLTYSQYIALMALAEEDGISITKLAKRLRITNASMTPLLKRLEQKGLVIREIEAKNERQKTVQITEMGRKMLAVSCEATEIVFRKTGLTQSQANSVIALCKLIIGEK